MSLPADTRQWPEEWRYRLEERLSIMLESDVPDAERKAEEDTRRQAAGGSQEELF